MLEETRRRFKQFDSIRGKTSSFPFWDVIILTAADDAQKHAFQLQLQTKLANGELPTCAEYIVVADPPGYKIGNGGSTLVVLEELKNKFGDSFTSKKTIIIHAGGFSQRLPIASILGKVFTAFPTREPIFQMLEVKLASYIDFPSKMANGGIFVCCSDTLEVYCDMGIGWKFKDSGITGLGHPSSIEIGTTHGVYILEESKVEDSLLVKCKKFLHKPTAECMHSTDNCVQTIDGRELVITDSAFYVAPDVCEVLLDFYKQKKPITCEIDAYGDFLQALGSESSNSYISNTINVVQQTDSLLQIRRLVYHQLRGTPLHVVVLAPGQHPVTSHFFHFGTTAEYLDLLTSDARLSQLTGCDVMAYCCGLPFKFKGNSPEGGDDVTDKVVLAPPRVMGCVVLAKVEVGQRSVVEYSFLGEYVRIGSCCIVSGCHLPASTVVPANTLLHTVAIGNKGDGDGKVEYVTLAFGVADSLKYSADPDKLPYFGRTLGDVFTDPDKLFSECSGKVSLWNARLFPAYESRQMSSSNACVTLERIARGEKDTSSLEGRYSMADLLKVKRVDEMIGFRSDLMKKIKASRFEQSAFSSLHKV